MQPSASGVGSQPAGPAANGEGRVSAAPFPYVLELPLPPTINHYYLNATRKRKGGGSYMARMLSEAAEAFRMDVIRATRKGHVTPPLLTGRLSIVVYACPVNAASWDLDNRWKPLLDALQNAKVIENDSLFDDERIVRGNIVPRGRAWLAINRFDPDAALAAVIAAGINPKLAERDPGTLPF